MSNNPSISLGNIVSFTEIPSTFFVTSSSELQLEKSPLLQTISEDSTPDISLIIPVRNDAGTHSNDDGLSKGFASTSSTIDKSADALQTRRGANVDIQYMSELQTETDNPGNRVIVIENNQVTAGRVDQHGIELPVSIDRVAKLRTVVQSSRNLIDIRDILLTDIRGKRIQNHYNENAELTAGLQNLLIDVILDHTFMRDAPATIPLDEIEKMAEEISLIFPSEDKSFYFIPSMNERAPSGRLITKYNSKLKKLRREGLFPPSSKETNKRRKLEIMEEKESDDQDDELQDRISRIMAYDNSLEVDIREIIEEWDITFEFRMRKIRRGESHQDVVQNWPVLQHPEAHCLIEIDFEKIFGNMLNDKPNLQESWNVVFSKSKIIFRTLNNAACRQILNSIDRFNTAETANEKNVIWSLALHGVFIPTVRGLGNGEMDKPSIMDSQDSFLQLTTDADLSAAIQEREKIRLSKNIIEHPFIVGISTVNEGVTKTNKRKMYNKFIYDIRDVQSIKTFKVVFGTLQFERENFLDALDFCFKFYKTFKIPFPESEKTWHFLDQLFYGLGKETSSKIVSVINQLK